jgi:hypothetical protein
MISFTSKVWMSKAPVAVELDGVRPMYLTGRPTFLLGTPNAWSGWPSWGPGNKSRKAVAIRGWTYDQAPRFFGSSCKNKCASEQFHPARKVEN